MDLEEARKIAEEVSTGNFKTLKNLRSEQIIARIGIALVTLDDWITKLEKALNHKPVVGGIR